MNIQLRDRPEVGSSVAAKTAIADCDTHPARATKTELYPYLAKRMTVSGKVKIEVIITPDGKVRSTRVVGGHPLLVQACQDAVKEWKFFPAPEESTQVIEFDFRGSN